MSEELMSQLCAYLGCLMYKKEHSFDWMERDELIRKINAVNILLDIDKHEPTFFEKFLNHDKT